MEKDKKETTVKVGPSHKSRDMQFVAITPDKNVEELAHLITMTPKDYVVDFSDKMHAHLWIARMLGELHTVYEINKIAKKTERKNVTLALIRSIRDHSLWKDAIKKMRINFLVDAFVDIPLSHTVVRIRELSELYYKLMGKCPLMKYKMNQAGEIQELGEDSEEFISFDKETATVEIHVGDEGHSIKIKKSKYFAEALRILDQIKIELENADLTLTSEAEFISIIRECGFKDYKV